MKFSDLLNEKYFKTVKLKGRAVEFFVNPSSDEVRKTIDKDGWGARFFIEDKKKPKIYAWPATFLHRDVIKHIPGKKLFGFYYEPGRAHSIMGDNSVGWLNWKDVKNKEEVIAAIKKMLPKVKYKSFWPELGFSYLHEI